MGALSKYFFDINIRNAMKGEYHPIEHAKEFIESMKGHAQIVNRKDKPSVYELPCSFDIETSSFYLNDGKMTQKAACMYVWQFGINGVVFVGRTWAEFKEFCGIVIDTFGLSGDLVLPIFVHSLKYEFQFIRKMFEWSYIFALSERDPIVARTVSGLEFRCSEHLSGTSLAHIDLFEYDVKKQVGSLNYDKIRHSETPLTADEIRYAVYDVLVVMCYIQECISRDGGIAKIPMTKTGYVRRLCRANCLYSKEYNPWQYRNLISKLILTVDEYKSVYRAFAGGFTHANAWNVGKIGIGLRSFDFTSSYPSVMVAEKFPMSKGERYTPKDANDFETTIKKYCCVFDLDIYDLNESFLYEHYISASKCFCLVNPVIDNGRVVSADRLCITVTELDFDIIMRTYTCSDFKVANMWRYRKGYLPKPYVETILKLYEDKTTLKDVPGEELHYALSKANLNSLYGMTVTNICKPEITYQTDWDKVKVDFEKSITAYNEDKTRFLSYVWGIYVTAYARHNLWTGILECGADYWYSDTDSIKCSNYDKHKQYFDNYNKTVAAKLKKACFCQGIDFAKCHPFTVKGKEKMLGVWDDEGEIKFKTLGAKRYITEKNGKLSITVAGVSKDAVKYLLHKYKTNDGVFAAFENHLEIPAQYMTDDDTTPKRAAGKMTHSYLDEERDGYITDYTGRVGYFRELSAVHLEPTTYNLSIGKDFGLYLAGIRI